MKCDLSFTLNRFEDNRIVLAFKTEAYRHSCGKSRMRMVPMTPAQENQLLNHILNSSSTEEVFQKIQAESFELGHL